MIILCEAFKGIEEDFMKNPDKFLPFFESPQNDHTLIPEPYESNLTYFEN